MVNVEFWEVICSFIDEISVSIALVSELITSWFNLYNLTISVGFVLKSSICLDVEPSESVIIFLIVAIDDSSLFENSIILKLVGVTGVCSWFGSSPLFIVGSSWTISLVSWFILFSGSFTGCSSLETLVSSETTSVLLVFWSVLFSESIGCSSLETLVSFEIV